MSARYAGCPVLIVGLGQSGLSAARYLAARGACLALTDSRAAPTTLAALRELAPDAPLVLGGLGAPAPLTDYRLAVVSPGVAVDDPFVRALAEAGVEVIGDIELFARALAETGGAPVIGITGSNGKSTVTEWVGAMAREAGWDVAVGGNLGTPALDLLPAPGAPQRRLYVLELSSFQLETTSSLVLAAATILNISEDHLDRHRTMARYIAAKARIYANAEVAVVNRDDPATATGVDAAARVVSFGLDAPAKGHYGLVRLDTADREADAEGSAAEALQAAFGATPLFRISSLRLEGLHNAANALASYALASAVGVPEVAMLRGLLNFGGLPHRCEWVADIDGVSWINDSKGTNVGATLAALNGLAAPLVWIGGGQGKGQDFSPLRAPLAAKARAAIVFGADAEALARTLEDVLPVRRAADLDAAVVAASREARHGDRVLLSPACASLDQFRNYEARGARFRECVHQLASASRSSAEVRA